MAMQSQGVYIRRASTVLVTSSASTSMAIQTSMVQCPGTIDFTALGFTTNMVLKTDNAMATASYPIKAVSATAINIWGSFPTTGSTAMILTGYNMQTVGEITDFNGPGGGAAVIEKSHLQSTAKEKLIGLRDEGQLSMTLNYNATDSGQDGMRTDRENRTRNLYDILFTDLTWSATSIPSRGAFWGYCQQFSISGAVDDKVSANAVIEIDGPMLYTTHDNV